MDDLSSEAVHSLLTSLFPSAMVEDLARRAIPLEGEEVFEIAEDLHRKYVDVEVQVEFRRGPYAGTRSWDTKRFRVVGVLVADADDYHFFITNLPRKWFLPADIATMYRCRWAVELLFRQLQSNKHSMNSTSLSSAKKPCGERSHFFARGRK